MDNILDKIVSDLQELEAEEQEKQEKQEEHLETFGLIDSSSPFFSLSCNSDRQKEARKRQNARYREKKKQELADLSVETGLDLALEDRRVHRIRVYKIRMSRE